jgi:hypothetical protein
MLLGFFCFTERQKLAFVSEVETKKAIIRSAAAKRISFNEYEASPSGDHASIQTRNPSLLL